MLNRLCTKCGVLKEENINNFYLRTNSDKFRSVCIECCLLDKKEKRATNLDIFIQRAAAFRANNPDKVKKYNKNYRFNNIEKEKSRVIEYKANNIDKIREYNRNYFNDKRANDPEYRLRNIISISVSRELRKNGSCKSGSILQFLPYTVIELKDHLEKQFEPWMNWDNYGVYDTKIWDDNDHSTWTWQLDHIIPHSSFKYLSMSDIDFQKCWSLNNLRPLNSKTNIIDGASRKRHK